MTSELAPKASVGTLYPELDPATVSSLNAKLVDIVLLLHGGALSDAQLRELTASIRVQIANTQTLHQFALSNADEPAFALCMAGCMAGATDHER